MKNKINPLKNVIISILIVSVLCLGAHLLSDSTIAPKDVVRVKIFKFQWHKTGPGQDQINDWLLNNNVKVDNIVAIRQSGSNNLTTISIFYKF